MTTKFHDPSIEFTGDISVGGALTLSGSQTLVGTLEVPFIRNDIQAGLVLLDLPDYVTVLSTHIEMVTPLAFSAGTTTGVSATVGNGDVDGLATSTALAGAAGKRLMGKGVLQGTPVAGGLETFAVYFTADTGTAPLLSEVSTGAGKVVVKYLEL